MMASGYYQPCKELDACNALNKYWFAQEYDKWFAGHLPLAEQGYPLAECQIGYCYWEGLGTARDVEQAIHWYREAARQDHGLALKKCSALNTGL